MLVRAGSDDTIDEALRYYRAVVGDRTPAELQETYVRGGAALIEYLEQRRAFRVQDPAVAGLLQLGGRRPQRRYASHRLEGGARQPPWPVPRTGSWTAGP